MGFYMYFDATPHEILYLKMQLLNFPTHLNGYKIVYYHKSAECDIIVNQNITTYQRVKIIIALNKQCKADYSQGNIIDISQILKNTSRDIPQIIKKHYRRKKHNKNVIQLEIRQEKLFN